MAYERDSQPIPAPEPRWRERLRRGANVTVLDLTPRLDAR